MKKDVHVTHRANKLWAVIREGASRASSLEKTQGKAIKVGKKIAINNSTELVIHNRKNKIRDSDSYGNESSTIDRKH